MADASLPPQPETGSTLAKDNDPVLIRTARQAKAFVLRDVASRIKDEYPLDALALRNMADELDPAKQEEF